PRSVPPSQLANGAITQSTTSRKGGVTMSSVRYSSATHQRCASQQVRLQPSGQTETWVSPLGQAPTLYGEALRGTQQFRWSPSPRLGRVAEYLERRVCVRPRALGRSTPTP